MNRSRKVMVVAAHPDDEVLGCGGTLIRHSQLGDDIHIVTLTDGVGSREAGGEAARNEALEFVVKKLGATNKAFSFPDNQMDTIPFLQIVQSIEAELDRYSPDLIYTHHYSDLNIDHKLCHQAVLTAVRPQPDCSVKEILCFEVPSATDWGASSNFNPNKFVRITEQLEEKETLLNAYEVELRAYPHARSKEAIWSRSIFRGTQVGLEHAEAFFIARKITL